MRIVQIAPNSNGSHNNQTANFPPNYKPHHGWAVIPHGLVTPGYPFGDVEAEEIDGIMTVTKWTEIDIPEPEPYTPEPEDTTSVQDLEDAMCELETATNERLDAIEEALCELDLEAQA